MEYGMDSEGLVKLEQSVLFLEKMDELNLILEIVGLNQTQMMPLLFILMIKKYHQLQRKHRPRSLSLTSRMETSLNLKKSIMSSFSMILK